MEDPEVCFSKWKKFIQREQLGGGNDVPDDFGLLGVYLLASLLPSDEKPHHLAPDVIYIGMSSHVTRRLDRSHHAVRQYKDDSGDNYLDKLYYSDWMSQWDNRKPNSDIGRAQLAFIYYIERKLIWEYAKKHQRLPMCNKY